VPLLALLPLLTGILWTLGFAQWHIGRVNLLTACLPTSLLGIGIDYALHLHAGHTHAGGLAPEQAWAHAFRRILPPLGVGMLTTTTAFLTLNCAELRGFHQMGLYGAVGLVLLFVFSLLCLPTLYDWGRHLRFRFRPVSMRWLVAAADWATRHRRLAVGLFVLVTLPMAWQTARMRFERDPRAYEDPSVPPIRLRNELAREMGVFFQPVLVASRTLAAERNVVLPDLVRPMVGEGKLFRHVDCLTLDFSRGETARLDFFRSRQPESEEVCMMLYPAKNPFEGDNLKEIHDAALRIKEQGGEAVVAVSGGPVLGEHARRLVRDDFIRTGLIASCAVLLILAFLVRRPRLYFAVITPLVGGVIWMIGIIRTSGYDFSMANAVTMPLVLGLGIDYGVHIVYRLRRNSVHIVMATTGRAIVVSALTTAGAFFALGAAGNRGLVAMGVAAGAGILSCLAWSVIFLPALLGQRGGESPVAGKGHAA
jgi:hypothetical protein